MTEKSILQWIKINLGGPINAAIAGTIYTEDKMGGMVMREVGFLIARYAPTNTPEEIWPLLRGDYGQRPGETQKRYHGYGPFQADINTAPQWIAAGKWKNPVEAAAKAVEILEDKRKELEPRMAEFPLLMERAIFAAYNCGAGRIPGALREGKDVDIFTYTHNYSAEIWQFAEIYKTLD